MPADLLDDLIIEMASVAQEVLANLVGVLQAAEDIVNQGDLAALLEVGANVLARGVNLLDPALVCRGRVLGYVLLELDDVRVGDRLGVGRRKNGRGIAVDGLKADLWRRCSASCERESDNASHCDWFKGRAKSMQPVTSTKAKRESRNDREEWEKKETNCDASQERFLMRCVGMGGWMMEG